MWFWLIEEVESVRRFLGLGGDVLVALFFLTLMMWALLLERWIYFMAVYPKQVKQTKATWLARSDHLSWSAKQIRRELVSRVAMAVDKGMPVIKVLIALCPLMGCSAPWWGWCRCLTPWPSPAPVRRERWHRGSPRQRYRPWRA